MLDVLMCFWTWKKITILMDGWITEWMVEKCNKVIIHTMVIFISTNFFVDLMTLFIFHFLFSALHFSMFFFLCLFTSRFFFSYNVFVVGTSIEQQQQQQNDDQQTKRTKYSIWPHYFYEIYKNILSTRKNGCILFYFCSYWTKKNKSILFFK